MATLYVSEFPKYSNLGAANPCMQEPSTDQTVVIGGGSTASAVFQATTRCIRVCPDATCSIVIGLAPTAATTNKRIPANAIEYFGIIPGAGWQIAVIANT